MHVAEMQPEEVIRKSPKLGNNSPWEGAMVPADRAGHRVHRPILWVVSLSLDPRNIARPTEFRLIPPGASLQAYLRVLDKPTANPVTFADWPSTNSSWRAASRTVGTDRHLRSLLVLPLRVQGPRRPDVERVDGADPAIRRDDSPPVRDAEPHQHRHRRAAVQPAQLAVGVGLALTSSELPFAIWNLKGYLDTIPRELEEAASIDGANPNQLFFDVIMPMATPVLAVTAFFGSTPAGRNSSRPGSF